MVAEWETFELWRKQIERRLYELGALAKGAVPIQADRINDCVEQIHELRKELEAVREKQEKMADFIKQHVAKHKNGGTT